MHRHALGGKFEPYTNNARLLRYRGSSPGACQYSAVHIPSQLPHPEALPRRPGPSSRAVKCRILHLGKTGPCFCRRDCRRSTGHAVESPCSPRFVHVDSAAAIRAMFPPEPVILLWERELNLFSPAFFRLDLVLSVSIISSETLSAHSSFRISPSQGER